MNKALIVAIDAYSGMPLQGCVNDARAIGACLQLPEFGFQTEFLLDQAATRKSFKASIAQVLNGADHSLVYFAGHGCKTDVTTYLVTHDGEEGDEGLDFHYLTAAINQLAKPDQTVTIVLDCCHAGAATPRSLQRARAMAAADVPTLFGTGRVVMAACKGDEKAHEIVVDGKSHGLFTHYLLEALAGRAADKYGRISITSCYEYVARNLENAGAQTPVLRGDQTGRIVLGSLQISGESSPEIPIDDLPNHVLEQAIVEAKSYLQKVFSVSQAYTHNDWLATGHREACQRVSPILAWFRRRLEESQSLQKNKDFQRCWNNIAQQYQALCTLTTGTVLEYSRTVENILGQGTFGTVWRVIDGSGKTLCFKSYHANDLRELDKVGRFKRGYEAMRQLDHPNIVKVFEFSEVPLGFYMDYVDGPNFRQLNPGSSIEPDQVIELLLRIAETLQHAHSRDVLHRDVKPENILLAADPKSGFYYPHLTDFDLAWFTTATQLTKAAEGFGSHFYAAPEQMSSPSSAAAHKTTVDSFSFGQVMFYGICGRDPAPFDSQVNHAMLARSLSARWRNEHAARALLALYDHCTQREPGKREDNFRTICDQLSAALADLRTSTDDLSSQQLLNELRYSVAGLPQGGEGHPAPRAGAVEFKSQSKRTFVTATIVREDTEDVTLDVVFIPDQLIVQARTAAEGREIVNSRIDNALNRYSKGHAIKRTPGKSGGFQTTITIARIEKSRDGLKRCREIVARVIDCIEGG